MAFLRAFGSYLPPERVGNDALATRTGRSADVILASTGIRERRYAAASDSVAGLGFNAASDCLEHAGVSAQELGLILFSSGSAERAFPGPAATLAAKLGLTATPALDLPVASAGSLIGIALAVDLASRYGDVLVVASEIMSRRISDADPDTAILFGDGAGACLVSPDSGFARIAGTSLSTDGNFADSLQMPHEGPIEMKGLSVIMQASRKIPRSIADLLAAHSISPHDVGMYLMHQANLNLIRKVASALEVPSERFFSNIERYGNTSSASLLIAASEWRSASIPSLSIASPVVMATFGAGFNWGSLLALPLV
jgi:3-oxoacyl-[acyl-carrier-protein] synthase-3